MYNLGKTLFAPSKPNIIDKSYIFIAPPTFFPSFEQFAKYNITLQTSKLENITKINGLLLIGG
jgi:hypothetical protein